MQERTKRLNFNFNHLILSLNPSISPSIRLRTIATSTWPSVVHKLFEIYPNHQNGFFQNLDPKGPQKYKSQIPHTKPETTMDLLEAMHRTIHYFYNKQETKYEVCNVTNTTTQRHKPSQI